VPHRPEGEQKDGENTVAIAAASVLIARRQLKDVVML
jgi:hypothetical protein